MDQAAIRRYVAETFDHVNVMMPSDGPGAGDTFFIYDPTGDLLPTQQFPFATMVTKDYGDFDNSSQLDRPDVFRLNIGIGRASFRSLFPIDVDPDYTALDQLLPHPVYASQSWVCVLNPSEATFERLKPLLAEAYGRAVERLKPR